MFLVVGIDLWEWEGHPSGSITECAFPHPLLPLPTSREMVEILPELDCWLLETGRKNVHEYWLQEPKLISKPKQNGGLNSLCWSFKEKVPFAVEKESCFGLQCPVYLLVLSEFRQSFLPSLPLTKQPWASLHLGSENRYLKVILWGFPGGPVVRTSPSNSEGVGLIPGWGAKISHALWPKHKTEVIW